MARLTEHFALEEFTVSDMAVRHGLDNRPDSSVERNLLRVAELLEQVRALLNGAPIKILSGYRSPEVNVLVGGSATSAHCLGLAADFVAPAYGAPIDICRAIETAALPYDQLIHEYGSWVHLGLSAGSPRQASLTICSRTRGYQSGIHECLSTRRNRQ